MRLGAGFFRSSIVRVPAKSSRMQAAPDNKVQINGFHQRTAPDFLCNRVSDKLNKISGCGIVVAKERSGQRLQMRP